MNGQVPGRSAPGVARTPAIVVFSAVRFRDGDQRIAEHRPAAGGRTRAVRRSRAGRSEKVPAGRRRAGSRPSQADARRPASRRVRVQVAACGVDAERLPELRHVGEGAVRQPFEVEHRTGVRLYQTGAPRLSKITLNAPGRLRCATPERRQVPPRRRVAGTLDRKRREVGGEAPEVVGPRLRASRQCQGEQLVGRHLPCDRPGSHRGPVERRRHARSRSSLMRERGRSGVAGHGIVLSGRGELREHASCRTRSARRATRPERPSHRTRRRSHRSPRRRRCRSSDRRRALTATRFVASAGCRVVQRRHLGPGRRTRVDRQVAVAARVGGDHVEHHRRRLGAAGNERDRDRSCGSRRPGTGRAVRRCRCGCRRCACH